MGHPRETQNGSSSRSEEPRLLPRSGLVISQDRIWRLLLSTSGRAPLKVCLPGHCRVYVNGLVIPLDWIWRLFSTSWEVVIEPLGLAPPIGVILGVILSCGRSIGALEGLCQRFPTSSSCIKLAAVVFRHLLQRRFDFSSSVMFSKTKHFVLTHKISRTIPLTQPQRYTSLNTRPSTRLLSFGATTLRQFP